MCSYELKPESDGKYQLKTRFAKFTNLPELMGMFKECADIRTADTLNLEKPEAHFHEVVAEPSKAQKRLIKSLSKIATAIRDGNVDPRDDNMLVITNDGRKIGLDQRLIDPTIPDNPDSKVNLCINNVYDIYSRTADKRSTQCIFCDMSTPKSDARQDRFEVYRHDAKSESGYSISRKKIGLGNGDEDNPKNINTFADVKSYIDKHSPEQSDKLSEGDIVVIRKPNMDDGKIYSQAAIFEDGKLNDVNSVELLEKLLMSDVEDIPPKEFNVYDDIKGKLMDRGVPENEIAFIHDYETAEQKQKLFDKMNAGEVRILLGSTQKCGAGMNAQAKMIALHHLDCPLRPSDVEPTKRNIFQIINRALNPAHKLVVDLDFLNFFPVNDLRSMYNYLVNKSVKNRGVKLGYKIEILYQINECINIFRGSLAAADFFFKLNYLIFKSDLLGFIFCGKLLKISFGNAAVDLIFVKT